RSLLSCDLTERVKNTDDRSEQSNEWRRRADGGKTTESTFQLRVNDGFRPLQCALGRLDLVLGYCAAAAKVAELLKTGGDDFGQMRLLVAIGHFHCLIELAFLQSTGNAGSKLTRLLAGCAEIEPAVDDDGQRPDRHDEQNDDDGLGQIAHIVPEIEWAEADCLLLEKGQRNGVNSLCEMSENHLNLSS